MKARLCLAVVGAAAVAVSMAFAQPAKEGGKPVQPAGRPAHPEQKQPGQPGDQHLPPGMTPEDMKAMADAATPGKQHAWLGECAGEWKGTSMMWMEPGTEPLKSEMTATMTSMMDGRFTRCEVKGDMPGMGQFNGFGIYGFDNVSQQFQATWVDNMGTGMMTGTGELSADGKTMTWDYSFHCPIAKKMVKMREVETRTDSNTLKWEMHGQHPKTGKEFKMMEINMTRTGSAPKVNSSR
ncbi:MAG TPA: DUF1579 domain-containing protein [Phycisphaerales bacterium]|nr:DUF1579 domain-containing protein [Phycisphaerales bacterium]